MSFSSLFKKKKTPEQVVALLAKDLADLSKYASDERVVEKVRHTDCRVSPLL